MNTTSEVLLILLKVYSSWKQLSLWPFRLHILLHYSICTSKSWCCFKCKFLLCYIRTNTKRYANSDQNRQKRPYSFDQSFHFHFILDIRGHFDRNGFLADSETMYLNFFAKEDVTASELNQLLTITSYNNVIFKWINHHITD